MSSRKAVLGGSIVLAVGLAVLAWGAVGSAGSTAYAGQDTPSTTPRTSTPGAGGTSTPVAGATTPAGGAATSTPAAGITPVAGTPTSAAGLPGTGTGGSDGGSMVWAIGAGAVLAALGGGTVLSGVLRRRQAL